jgi:hypothetical protein
MDRLPQMMVPDFAEVDEGDETAWKLRGLATPFSESDTSGRIGHRWPGSGLTADDMCKLRILSNLTGVPGTELLHTAVGLLFKQTRDATNGLLRDQETCEPRLKAGTNIGVSGAEPTAVASAVAASGSHRHLYSRRLPICLIDRSVGLAPYAPQSTKVPNL